MAEVGLEEASTSLISNLTEATDTINTRQTHIYLLITVDYETIQVTKTTSLNLQDTD